MVAVVVLLVVLESHKLEFVEMVVPFVIVAVVSVEFEIVEVAEELGSLSVAGVVPFEAVELDQAFAMVAVVAGMVLALVE